MHGTHVAGVAVAGNPFARILHVTENWPYKAIPDAAPTIEDGARWGAAAKQAVAYMQKGGVRVVNMSWRIGRSAIEEMLETKGVGATRRSGPRFRGRSLPDFTTGWRKPSAARGDFIHRRIGQRRQRC